MKIKYKPKIEIDSTEKSVIQELYDIAVSILSDGNIIDDVECSDWISIENTLHSMLYED